MLYLIFKTVLFFVYKFLHFNSRMLKVAKFKSIYNARDILRVSFQNLVVASRIHTSKGWYQSEPATAIELKRYEIFPVNNHGDYEWQDPKSESEM